MDRPVVGVIGRTVDKLDRIRPALEAHFDTNMPPLRIEENGSDRDEILGEASVLLSSGIKEADLPLASELSWVQALSAGVDSYPLEALKEYEVLLTNVSGVHAEPIAQQVLGYMLVFERRIHDGMAQQRNGEWESYQGGELGDHTLGILGVGAIGTRVAELGSALGMSVAGVKRDPNDAPAVLDECYGPNDLDELLSQSTYLVIACPLTNETRGMIGAEELKALPSESVLVNIARGAVVDEAALIDALQGNVIRGAALDVFEEEPLPSDSPLRTMDNVIMTPHMAGSTPHYYDRAIRIFAENYRSFAAGELDKMCNRII